MAERPRNHDKQISTRVPDEEYQAVQDLAARYKVTVSVIIRWALEFARQHRGFPPARRAPHEVQTASEEVTT